VGAQLEAPGEQGDTSVFRLQQNSLVTFCFSKGRQLVAEWCFLAAEGTPKVTGTASSLPKVLQHSIPVPQGPPGQGGTSLLVRKAGCGWRWED